MTNIRKVPKGKERKITNEDENESTESGKGN